MHLFTKQRTQFTGRSPRSRGPRRPPPAQPPSSSLPAAPWAATAPTRPRSRSAESFASYHYKAGHIWSQLVTNCSLVTAGHNWSLLVTSGHNWSHLDIPCYLVSYPYLVTPGHSWSQLVTAGHIWSQHATPCRNLPSRSTCYYSKSKTWSQLVTAGHTWSRTFSGPKSDRAPPPREGFGPLSPKAEEE